MSERYDNCSGCRGMGVVNIQDRLPGGSYGPKRREECASCLGTGESGSALDYVHNESKREPEYLKPKAREDEHR